MRLKQRSWRGAPQPYAGRGLVLGNDREGETRSVTWTVDQVRRCVSFRHYKVEGFVEETGTMDHPLLGPDTSFYKQTPVFGPADNDDEQ